MCGIAGILELDRISPSQPILQAMGDRLRHRGPDGDGIYIDGPCGLVHRRLAILDPDRGKQPLSNTDGTIWITYNGEIYNSPDLRHYLQGKGHVFRTTTDTEVIVHLYEQEPDRFVEKLEGIFAFGIWDSRRECLIVARDYLGVKPLYVYTNPDCFLFASEVKALLADPRVPCQPDEKGLIEILSFQNTYPGRTSFKDISLLEGGEIRVIQRGKAPSCRKYWTFQKPENFIRRDQEETVSQLRDLVQTVIRDQLLSDVPVASYLSGGMDTGTLTAVASRSLPNLVTFSGGFRLDGVPDDQRSVDEREAAQLMSREFGTNHFFREILPDDLLTSFSAISWHLEEPRGSTCYAPWTMAQLAGTKVKVILSGHGGDELFAGYRARYEAAQRAGEDWENVWFSHLNYLVPQAQALQWLHPDFATPELLAWSRQVFDDFVQQSRGLTAMSRAQHHDLFVYMQGLLLIEDKLSMAQSLESRVPFLDRRLFDLAWSIPDDWKISQQRGKAILREALQGVIPEAILTRDKMGFGPPDNHYYRTSLRPFFQNMLIDEGFAQRGIVKAEVIAKIFERHLNGEPLAPALWTFASIEMWYRNFIDRAAELRATSLNSQPKPIELEISEGKNLTAPNVAALTKLQQEQELAQTTDLSVRLQGREFYKKVVSQIKAQLKKIPLAVKMYRKASSGLTKILKIAGKFRKIPAKVRKIPAKVRKTISAVSAKLVWSPALSVYTRVWWALSSGHYALQLRENLQKQLLLIPRPQPEKTLRIFQGLYSTVQPVFLKQAWENKGLLSSYETLDKNPNYLAPDDYHAHIFHSDFYYEHVEFERDILLPRKPTVTDYYNLNKQYEFFLERWSKYDVYHFNWFLSFLPDNLDVEFLRRSGRGVYFHFRGCFILTKIITEFTENGEDVADACRYCQKMGWRDVYFSRFHRGVSNASRVFVSTPNLCHCSPDFEYLPLSLEPTMESIPRKEYSKDNPDEPIIVIHAPSSSAVYDVKGTSHVKKAIETLQKEGLNLELRLIENMARAEAVKQFAQGDIFVEQVHLGSYGNTAVEAMAYGLPVISSHHPSHAYLIPNCPVVHADPLTLTDRLREIVINRELREQLGQQAYQFVRDFHSNERVSSYLLNLYQQDLGIKPSKARNTINNKTPNYD
jgi:asparagine synthase (glutamine-hydrolysing)